MIESTSVNYWLPFCTHMFVFPTCLPVCPCAEYLVSVFVEWFGRPIMLILSIANSLCSDKPKRSRFVSLLVSSCLCKLLRSTSPLHALSVYTALRLKFLGRN